MPASSRVSLADPHVAVQPSLASRAMKAQSETTEEIWSSGPGNEVSDSSCWKFVSVERQRGGSTLTTSSKIKPQRSIRPSTEIPPRIETPTSLPESSRTAPILPSGIINFPHSSTFTQNEASESRNCEWLTRSSVAAPHVAVQPLQAFQSVQAHK